MAYVRPTLVDETPLSEFVCEMKRLLAQRLEARGARDKAAVDREMRGVMKQYLGRDTWQAMVDAENAEATRPDARKRPRQRGRGKAGRRRYVGSFDYKRAQARDTNDE